MELSSQDRIKFRKGLLRWYDANKRDLPWRRTKDPYAIWVSEIMLQQTRVGAVLDHYRRFVEKFPSVQSLAGVREQTVLASWSGLGYYRRARNMHAAAKVVASLHDGVFPTTAEALRELPGIGRYTAAAIASIAFNEPTAVVDGNVERVLARVTGSAALTQRETWDLAESLLSPKRPGDFNQAIMELGATICLPRDPKCVACPVMMHCLTRGPLAPKKREERRTQSLSLGLAKNKGDSIWLTQRPKSAALMPGMWELPEIVSNGHALLGRFKHSILHTDFHVTVYQAEPGSSDGRWFTKANLSKVALTGLARKILRRFEYLTLNHEPPGNRQTSS